MYLPAESFRFDQPPSRTDMSHHRLLFPIEPLSSSLSGCHNLQFSRLSLGTWVVGSNSAEGYLGWRGPVWLGVADLDYRWVNYHPGFQRNEGFEERKTDN